MKRAATTCFLATLSMTVVVLACAQEASPVFTQGSVLSSAEELAGRSSITSWSLRAVLTTDAGDTISLLSRFAQISVNQKTESINVDSLTSSWSFNEVFVDLHVLTESTSQQFSYEESISRAALGLAGFSTDKGAATVWLNANALKFEEDTECSDEVALNAWVDNVNVNLSFTQLNCTQAFTIDNISGSIQFFELVKGHVGINKIISGYAWLERGIGPDMSIFKSTTASVPVVVDQFRLRLPNKDYLLLIRSRRRDGSGTPVLSAVRISASGLQELDYRELQLSDERLWSSPTSDLQYSVSWVLQAPLGNHSDQKIQIKATMVEQEVLVFGRSHWMGQIIVDWIKAGDKFTTYGFAEISPILSEKEP